MENYFEIVKYAQCENLKIEVTLNNAYLGVDGKTLLTLEDELMVILEELTATKYKDSNLVYKIGELEICGLLMSYSELFECPFNVSEFSELESKIKEVLKFVPYIDVNDLLDTANIKNPNGLVWHNEFLSPEFIRRYGILADSLNQKQIKIESTHDLKIFLNAGDILSAIDTDDYYTECYFKPKYIKCKHWYYEELTPIKYEILKNIVNGNTKVLFKNKVVKAEVFEQFLSNLTYSIARLNYREDLDDEYFVNLHKFTKQLAMADLLS